MAGGGVGRKSGRGVAWMHFRKGVGNHRIEVMELIYRSRFNYIKQVNSASGNNGLESSSVAKGLLIINCFPSKSFKLCCHQKSSVSPVSSRRGRPALSRQSVLSIFVNTICLVNAASV